MTAIDVPRRDRPIAAPTRVNGEPRWWQWLVASATAHSGVALVAYRLTLDDG